LREIKLNFWNNELASRSDFVAFVGSMWWKGAGDLVLLQRLIRDEEG
jgi:hypothetical protein